MKKQKSKKIDDDMICWFDGMIVCGL